MGIIPVSPEIVKSEPYGEKADVWAAGCILYQMVTLNPPFHSSNMLSLATKIVEAAYEPVPEGLYSCKVLETIKRCLTSDAEARPDIVEVSALISDIMMKYMDDICTVQLNLEKKLERERRRTQRYFMEANRNVMTYHQQLSMISQEHCDKSSLASSSEGASLRSESSEIAELSPLDDMQTLHAKDADDRLSDTVFLDDNTHSAENTEKDVCSEMDDDLDTSDHSNSSSPSPTKYSTLTSAGIAVSQRKVRQISDPIQQILIQLHKIIYITQLPPTLHHNFRKSVIERFKKSLFSPQSNPCNLKAELKKLLQGSPELIELNFVTADCSLMHQTSRENSVFPGDRAGNMCKFFLLWDQTDVLSYSVHPCFQ
uniref:Protein kinase domain-containing protein n=1 Tax=Callorhinchus milii TaxID=7868 RepID=A0A4W3JID0_CALMI